MSMKILSPCGDMENLKVAIYNGADEVYLGVKNFNARNNIQGFDLSSLEEAVLFAHLRGVRVFLTVNILFTDEEMQDALDLVVDAYNLGVDAFIIQDIGLAQLLHENFPEIEIHASTQMGIHNLEGVSTIEKFGFKRVVLARETTLVEIERIRKNSDIEIEYFVQGALCVCFSGNCYLSSYLFGASGNRGKCKQPCRLPYSFWDGDKKIKEGYLLSAKDFNMLDRLKDLEKAGVTSLKIEGRARRPFYVGVATKIYKDALRGKAVSTQDLALAFNRQYTAGYFDGNGNIISKNQNHIGIRIGKVERFVSGKKFNEIYVSSNYPLPTKATFKFFDKDEEVCSLSSHDVKEDGKLFRITSTQSVKVGNFVNLIADAEKEEKVLSFSNKRKLNVQFVAKVGEKMLAKTSDFGEEICVEGDFCQPAKNSPLKAEEVENCFNKNEFFEPKMDFEIENVFVVKQKLNELRRQFYDAVLKNIKEKYSRKISKKFIKIPKKIAKKIKNYEIIEKIPQKLPNFENIIYSPEFYDIFDVAKFKETCEKENKNAILNLPNFALEKDIALLKEIVKKTGIAILINNCYALDFDAKKYIGGGMNVYNSFAVNCLKADYLCAENDDQFFMPYMTLRHCPMKQHLGASCDKCPYKDGFSYKMQNGETLRLKRVKMSTCTFYLCK